VGARLPAVQAVTVGVAAPDRVNLGEVGVGAPVAGVDQRQQARAVRSGLGAEDPGGGAAPVAVRDGVGGGGRADVVVGGGFVELCDSSYRIVDEGDDVRERVTEEP